MHTCSGLKAEILGFHILIQAMKLAVPRKRLEIYSLMTIGINKSALFPGWSRNSGRLRDGPRKISKSFAPINLSLKVRLQILSRLKLNPVANRYGVSQPRSNR